MTAKGVSVAVVLSVFLSYQVAIAGQNIVASIPRSRVKQDLKARLGEKYAGSYSTQKMLLDAGMRAYDELCGLPGNQVNNEILTGLIKKYYPSFSTIKLLYKSNIKAYHELND